MPEQNSLASRKLYALRLSKEVTLDLYLEPRIPKRWVLLTKKGEFMRLKEGDENAHLLEFATWPDAVRGANLNGTNFIACIHRRCVLFRATDDAGEHEWWPAILIIDPYIEYVNHAEANRYEPDAEGKQPKRKRPSGAQNRKRYGGFKQR